MEPILFCYTRTVHMVIRVIRILVQTGLACWIVVLFMQLPTLAEAVKWEDGGMKMENCLKRKTLLRILMIVQSI